MRPFLRTSLFVAMVFAMQERGLGDCPERYLRFHKKPTFCQAPNDQCEVVERGLKDGDIETLLRLHNEKRSYIARGKETTYHIPKAADMLQLEWDDELAQIAQAHADQCEDEHDCKPCRRSKNFQVGQNLYRANGDVPERNYEEAVQNFYDEGERFDKAWLKSFNPLKAKGPIGHFTQLVWAKTWKVGCGYVAFKQDGGVSEIYVCNYGPSGNFMKEPVFTEGAPCSKCPENTCCGSDCKKSPNYEGLCQVEDGKVPHYPMPKKGLLYHCDFINEKSCKLDLKGPWEMEETLSGKHLTIVLKAGEKASFGVKSSFPRKPGFCMKFAYTKGANKAGEKGSNEAKQVYNFGRMAPKMNLPDSDTTMIHEMKLHFPRAFKFTVTFSVPKGSSPQYFDIEEFYITKVGCK